MLKIKCPECGVSGSISLHQTVYEGPYRCWKCRSLFTVRIENNEMKSRTPLSQEDFEKWQELHNALNRQTGE
ncbi:MAG: hypothetical protein ACE5LA_00195 [Dehalococcoidales bacterium]